MNEKELDKYIEALTAFYPTREQMDYVKSHYEFVSSHSEYNDKVVAMLSRQKKAGFMEVASLVVDKWDAFKKNVNQKVQLQDYGHVQAMAFSKGDDNNELFDKIQMEYDKKKELLVIYAHQDIDFILGVNEEVRQPDKKMRSIFDDDIFIYRYQNIKKEDKIQVLESV
ncbi:MAG: hypothetical protein LUH02_12405 [Erysipelotrichaceae bacterium]|nr:hypothetical protein [Erysipelotrichaceae bacterium]